MATGCGDEYSDETKEMLNEALDPPEIPDWITKELDKPEVKEKIESEMEERVIECLKENVGNAKNELREKLNQEGKKPTDLEKLDLEIEPTRKEYQEVYKIGTELGMQPWEIVNTPVIIGIKDPNTLERMENMEKRIRDVMSNLHTSKLLPKFRDIGVVDIIIFIDKEEPAERKDMRVRGSVLGKGILVSRPEISRVGHIFRDDTGKLPEGKQAHRVVIHEICHLNMFKERLGEPSEFTKIFVAHFKEWAKACNAQLDGPGVVSKAAENCIPKDGPREAAFLHPEFIAEHVAFWDSELAEICPEMDAFFDKYLAEK